MSPRFLKKGTKATSNTGRTRHEKPRRSDAASSAAARLQDFAGNHGVLTRSPVHVQRKLVVGSSNDQFEQEADRVAEQVMRMPAEAHDNIAATLFGASNHGLQRKCACGGTPGPAGECDVCRKKRLSLQRRASNGHKPADVPPIVHEVLSSPGQPLDSVTRAFMEPRLGYDFSQVRVHADHEASDSADAVRARAYTVGRDIVFAPREYVPSTVAGKQLLAHELAHVIQQGAGGPVAARTVLQRYSHEDCTEADLRAHIWPADHVARTQVDAAITAVTASPVSSSTASLFSKYFMTSSPDTAAIARIFRSVKAAFDQNSYTYECEEDCDAGDNAYSGWAWDIHLCMNNLRGRANDCIARTIVHEFSHKYAGMGHGWWFGTARCYSGCDNAGCPATLSASDALDNAYSVAGFAREV